MLNAMSSALGKNDMMAYLTMMAVRLIELHRVLKPSGRAADIHPHGYGDVCDFLGIPHETNSFDWVITNPPFRLGEDFTLLALKLARRGVAMLTRTVFIESARRDYRRSASNLEKSMCLL